MPPAVVITGVKAIDRRLRTLEPRVQKKVLRQSMRAGMKIIQTEMKAQVPVDKGLTKKSVKVRALKQKGRKRIGIEVRVSGPGMVKTRNGGKRFFLPSGIEYGTKENPPNPFGRRTY